MSDGHAAPRGGTAARRAAKGVDPAPGTRPGGTPSRPTGASSPSGRPPKGGARRGATRRQLDPDTLAALEEERDFLLRSLEDLEREHDAGDVDDTDYAELKDDYTARAAAVLRAIDDRRELAAATAPGRSWGRTAGILAVVGVLALGVGWFVFRDAGTRAPGQGLSGDIRQDSANLNFQGQQHLALAQQALRDGDSDAAVASFQDAITSYDAVLEIAPDNAEAMTWRGWTLHNIALATPTPAQAAELDAQAMEWLDRAVTADDGFALAHLFRAILLSQLGEFEQAQADLDAMDASQIPVAMASEVENLRAEVAAGLAGSTDPTIVP